MRRFCLAPRHSSNAARDHEYVIPQEGAKTESVSVASERFQPKGALGAGEPTREDLLLKHGPVRRKNILAESIEAEK